VQPSCAMRRFKLLTTRRFFNVSLTPSCTPTTLRLQCGALHMSYIKRLSRVSKPQYCDLKTIRFIPEYVRRSFFAGQKFFQRHWYFGHDHLGTREMRESSLRTVDTSRDMRCINVAILALDSSRTARSHTSAIFTNKIHLLIKFRILNFVWRYFSYIIKCKSNWIHRKNKHLLLYQCKICADHMTLLQTVTRCLSKTYKWQTSSTAYSHFARLVYRYISWLSCLRDIIW